MAALSPGGSAVATTSPAAAAPLCPRCGFPQVDVHDAQGDHAWWHCVYCHDVPYVPLDWGVRWSTARESIAALRGEAPR